MNAKLLPLESSLKPLEKRLIIEAKATPSVISFKPTFPFLSA